MLQKAKDGRSSRRMDIGIGDDSGMGPAFFPSSSPIPILSLQSTEFRCLTFAYTYAVIQCTDISAQIFYYYYIIFPFPYLFLRREEMSWSSPLHFVFFFVDFILSSKLAARHVPVVVPIRRTKLNFFIFFPLTPSLRYPIRSVHKVLLEWDLYIVLLLLLLLLSYNSTPAINFSPIIIFKSIFQAELSKSWVGLTKPGRNERAEVRSWLQEYVFQWHGTLGTPLLSFLEAAPVSVWDPDWTKGSCRLSTLSVSISIFLLMAMGCDGIWCDREKLPFILLLLLRP